MAEQPQHQRSGADIVPILADLIPDPWPKGWPPRDMCEFVRRLGAGHDEHIEIAYGLPDVDHPQGRSKW